MDPKKTYDSDDSDNHLLFIEILERTPNVIKNIIAQSEVDNYENGPYIKLRITDNKNIMNYIQRKSIVTSIISDTYKKMISYLSTSLYMHTSYTRFLDIIDIYFNNNAGLQISLEYYLIVNQDTIDQVISDYNRDNNIENKKPEETSMLSYALSFIF